MNGKGEIKKEIALPAGLLAVETRFGFEGVTRIGETLWMAVQRAWKDDPKNHVKLASYNIDTGELGAVRYEKAAPVPRRSGCRPLFALYPRYRQRLRLARKGRGKWHAYAKWEACGSAGR
ncbi:phytase-like protein with esterase activity [Rhodovulum bhavnagarense]|uniref:Phytase-like protein with esterase activity n=1 Tax=Rhodovulum bhavnagarense TaxID=992286 RepID=A0A4R2R9K8_9RHOB|nr:phytase-like protein with esterase activity [Rhodovulum bhavnagarense]